MNVELFKKEFLPRFINSGEDKFYKSLLLISLNKLVMIEKGIYRGTLPHLELLNYYEQLIILYRREGEDVYLKVAKTFRRAAHKIYRVMLKKNMCPVNTKFLNVV